MDSLQLQAPAKINWRLSITGRRENGYHELDMIMQTIRLHDTLLISPSSDNRLTINGAPEANPDNNLIVKAAKALSSLTGEKLCARFELTKRIPSMAGLGGGSSDCAQTLIGLNLLYSLGLSLKQLCSVALKLGADVPFFLYGGLCRVQGIGEYVEKLESAPVARLLIFHVLPGLSTPAVYAQYDRQPGSGPVYDTDMFLEGLTHEDYKALEPFNSLEAPAISLLPEISSIKQELINLGADYTLMSGSGSAVYAVFSDDAAARFAQKCLPGSILTYSSDDFA